MRDAEMARPILPLLEQLAKALPGAASVAPEKVRSLAAMHFADTLGCMLAALGHEGMDAYMRHALRDGRIPEASATGIAERIGAPQAAFVNGVLARAQEFDDMALPDLHPSGVVAPVCMATGELAGRSGPEILSAFVVGVELCIRLSQAALGPAGRTSRLLDRGLDAAAIFGAVAASASAGLLLGLTDERLADAIAISVSMASGSIEANRTGGTVKQMQSGWAAQSAVRAALLAVDGVTGPKTALEGRYGLFHNVADGFLEPRILREGWGEDWVSERLLRIKPYPCNYYAHSTIDAALALRARGIRPDDVEAVDLAVAETMLRAVGQPIERKRAPATGYQARFSAPFAFAAALSGGGGLGLALSDFSNDRIAEPAIARLMQRVSVRSSSELDALFPAQAGVHMTCRLSNGETVSATIDANRGSAARPLQADEVRTKYMDNATRCLSIADAELLWSTVAEAARGQGSLALDLLRGAKAKTGTP